VRLLYETCAPGVPDFLDNPIMQQTTYAEVGLERWRRELSQGAVIAGPVEQLPESERGLLEAQTVQSVLALPVMVEANWKGFIVFHDVERDRTWDEETIQLLQTAADMIGAHVAQQEMKDQIEDSLARRSRQVALSAQVAQEIAGSRPLDELYQWLVEAINQAFGYTHTPILSYESSQGVSVLPVAVCHAGP
jgi:transcriptional regulator with GAF, ATPase, and Fis domain